MLTPFLLSSLCLFGSPEPPADTTDPFGAVAPPAAVAIDVAGSEGTFDDGTQYWVRTVTYELASGDVGEAHMVIASDGYGTLQISINGEVIASAESSDTELGPLLHTWTVPETNYPGDVLAQINQPRVGEELLVGVIPQEFKCSAWGRKAVRMAKYLWIGVSGATGAVCCMATTAGCPLCVAGAGIASAVGTDAANGYCD
jgi:hypothetical protein